MKPTPILTGQDLFGVNLVTWRSKKQNVVIRSSAEADYRAMSQGIYEEIWLKKVPSDLHQDNDLPMKLYVIIRLLIALQTIQFNMIKKNMWRLIDTS